jgi:hypothetical protein
VSEKRPEAVKNSEKNPLEIKFKPTNIHEIMNSRYSALIRGRANAKLNLDDVMDERRLVLRINSAGGEAISASAKASAISGTSSNNSGTK